MDFEKIKVTTMTQVDDEVQMLIEDGGVTAHVSYNNEVYREWLYLSYIYSSVKFVGHGTKFMTKLKEWAREKGHKGIFLWMEGEHLLHFYTKNGFMEREDGFYFIEFNQN